MYNRRPQSAGRLRIQQAQEARRLKYQHNTGRPRSPRNTTVSGKSIHVQSTVSALDNGKDAAEAEIISPTSRKGAQLGPCLAAGLNANIVHELNSKIQNHDRLREPKPGAHIECYDILGELGRGQNATAYKVKSKNDKAYYVLKRVELVGLNPAEKKLAVNEVSVLAQLRHPNIIRLYEHFFDQEALCLIFEFAAGGTLQQMIHEHQVTQQAINKNLQWRLCMELCQAAQYLHSADIIHRDITPSNVFISSDHHVKLGDLGSACIAATRITDDFVGTPLYFAPEVLHKQPYDKGVDVWAIGCVMYNVVTLSAPFEAENIFGLMFEVGNKEIEFPPHAGVSENLQQIIKKALTKDINSRPSPSQLLKELPSDVAYRVPPADSYLSDNSPFPLPPSAYPSGSSGGSGSGEFGKGDDVVMTDARPARPASATTRRELRPSSSGSIHRAVIQGSVLHSHAQAQNDTEKRASPHTPTRRLSRPQSASPARPGAKQISVKQFKPTEIIQSPVQYPSTSPANASAGRPGSSGSMKTIQLPSGMSMPRLGGYTLPSNGSLTLKEQSAASTTGASSSRRRPTINDLL
eukprot:GFYU01007336.1.p1 GENE.GFYU01007336.1~~GFYU01007336.1.p1  ORF type:complete len:578 (-),score=81.82 GFYU01007336.1:129-1862(-)